MRSPLYRSSKLILMRFVVVSDSVLYVVRKGAGGVYICVACARVLARGVIGANSVW